MLSARQRVYFLWLSLRRAQQMLDRCNNQADYTKIKDAMLRSVRTNGGSVDMKPIPEMGWDMIAWITAEANALRNK